MVPGATRSVRHKGGPVADPGHDERPRRVAIRATRLTVRRRRAVTGGHCRQGSAQAL